MTTDPIPGGLEEMFELAESPDVPHSLFDSISVSRERRNERSGSRRLAALDRMLASGSMRELTTVTASMVDDLSTLEAAHPNCKAVIDRVRRQLALRRIAQPPVLAWSPMLLDGPPGVGKTCFAQALARFLGNELALINCSSMTAGFVLAGNSPSWAESRPGKVFETLCKSRFGNPIVLLDEVDKLSTDRHFDGYGPLHQLLEPDTAKAFVDEHIGVPVDASHIVWLATANNLAKLPEPILSRFEVVSIAAPDREQSTAIAQSVYSNLLDDNAGWQRAFDPRLPKAVAEVVAGITPREMRQALLDAMGTAALSQAGQRRIRLHVADVEARPKAVGQPMGFLS